MTGLERSSHSRLGRPASPPFLTLARDARTATATLLFERGARPSAEDLRKFAEAQRSFVVSHEPELDPTIASPSSERLLEVISTGLIFDLRGFASGPSRPVPSAAYRYGVPADLDRNALEALTILPGPHISSDRPTMPVTRGLAMLAAELTALPGVVAVGWQSARSWSSPEHFRSSVTRWVEGGAFPALGLTALAPTTDGGIQSEGLTLFTGQEMWLSPELARDRKAGARLAIRLLHWMVAHGKVKASIALPGPSGEPLLLEPSTDRRIVSVSHG